MSDPLEALRRIDARLASVSRSMPARGPVTARRVRPEIDRLLDLRLRCMALRDEREVAAFRHWLDVAV